MRFKVLKPLSANGENGKLYKPGDVYDDGGRNSAYEREQLQALEVIESLPDELPALNAAEQEP